MKNYSGRSTGGAREVFNELLKAVINTEKYRYHGPAQHWVHMVHRDMEPEEFEGAPSARPTTPHVKGPISVTSMSKDKKFPVSHAGRKGYVFHGTPTHHFPFDAHSNWDQKTGKRVATRQTSEGTKSESWDEAWLHPSRSKLVGHIYHTKERTVEGFKKDKEGLRFLHQHPQHKAFVRLAHGPIHEVQHDWINQHLDVGHRGEKQMKSHSNRLPLGYFAELNKSSVEVRTAEKGEKAGRGEHKSPPKEYREGGAVSQKDYAAPGYKYPVDTEAHVRAAVSYFSKPKNADVYSKEQQKKIWGKIKGAAKREGIKLGKKSGPPTVEKSDKEKQVELDPDFMTAHHTVLSIHHQQAGNEGMAQYHEKMARQIGGKPTKEHMKAAWDRISAPRERAVSSLRKFRKAAELLGDLISKAEDVDKAKLGSFKITRVGPVQEGTGMHMDKVLKDKALEREKQEAAPSLSNKEEKKVEKALTSRSLPKVPKAALFDQDPMRSGTLVLTRDNSRYAGNTFTGPLRGELLDLDDNGQVKQVAMHKSCGSCGRVYLAKSTHDGCPTCSISKSLVCNKCGQTLVKSHGGFRGCPICG